MGYYRATRSKEVVANDERKPLFLAEQLGFLKKNEELKPTVAAILLFGKNPQAILKVSSIDAVRFRGVELADQIIDRREIIGTSNELIEKATDFVRAFSAVGSAITSESLLRTETNEYPFVAVREAIANAVVHRDYTNMGSQIKVHMFDDRTEITSPGGLGGGITQADLADNKGKSWLRNPNLAGVLYEMRLVEKAGTGVARIFRGMQENGSPPPSFSVDSNTVKVILKAHPEYTARRMYEEAVLAKDRGEVEKARALLEGAIKVKPGYADATSVLASLEGELGEVATARRLYGAVVRDNPRSTYSILAWAALEDKVGNKEQAKSLYERVLSLDPNNLRALHSLGVIERYVGNTANARKLFQKTIEIAPDNSANWQALGQTESKARNYEEAVKLLNKALKLAKDDHARAWIHSDLAFSLNRLRRPMSQVEEHYKASLELNPSSAHVNHSYAVFLRRFKRGYEAQAYETKAKLLGWREKEPVGGG
jgi:tetratricopeptide (TPR) repeat protein